MNILDFFAGRRSWRQLYNFIERLPHWGHYKSTLAMDDEWASRMLDREEAGQDPLPGTQEPTPLGYSDIVARLDLIADRTMAVRTAVQASYSKDYEEPTFEPIARPVTAMDRERERRTRTVLNEIDAMFRSGDL